MSFNWKLTMGHLFPPFFHQLWKNIISWMSHHNAGNLTFIFSVFFNPILSKLDVWTHPTLPKLLLNHHLLKVSYSASICTWCPSIMLEIVIVFFLFIFYIFWTQSCQNGMFEHNEHTLAIVVTFFFIPFFIFGTEI